MAISDPPDEIAAAEPAADDGAAAAASRGDFSEIPQLQQLLADAQKSESEARCSLRFLTALVDLLPVGLTLQSDAGEVLFANSAAAQAAGGPVGAPPASTSGREAPSTCGGAGAEAARPAVTTTEERIVGPGGERTLLRCTRAVNILDRPLLLTAAVDFTERKRTELELSRRAHFDDLTGLPNRILVEEHVEQLLATVPRESGFALAFLDIDNFKHINDYYTHAIGDELLVKVSQRIAAHVRPSDILGRISGDEFLLVLNPINRDDDLGPIISNLLQQLKEPFFIEGFEIFTSASIGLSVFPDHGTSYEMLRRAADTAMYQIKNGAKGDAVLFDTEMGRAMNTRMAQEQRLRLAVRDNRFCCAFQPKVDIRSQQVVGVEALIRLRDENGDVQAPSHFIGLAKELGLIDDLTNQALEQIVRSMDLIDEAFGPEATISINIAAKQACNLKFMSDFCEALVATGKASRFMVEVTEDAFVVKSLFQVKVLPMLREIGTGVSIDDFGTGFSSLGALADITADEVKIDRSFITDIHKRPRSQSILKAIEALSEHLGMTVIAEGVETMEEVAFLQAATRIRYAQGYYFSRPILMEDLTPLRRGGNARARPGPRERSPLRICR